MMVALAAGARVLSSPLSSSFLRGRKGARAPPASLPVRVNFTSRRGSVRCVCIIASALLRLFPRIVLILYSPTIRPIIYLSTVPSIFSPYYRLVSDNPPAGALASLCLVSRGFAALAQPQLFRWYDAGLWKRLGRSAHLRFLGDAVLMNPGLALPVKEAHLDDDRWFAPEAVEPARYAGILHRRLAKRLGLDDEVFPYPDSESAEGAVAVFSLLSLLFFPNLERLWVNMTYPAIALDLLGRLSTLGVAKPLGRVRDLTLQTMGDSRSFELSDYFPLLALARNLTALRLVRCCEASDLEEEEKAGFPGLRALGYGWPPVPEYSIINMPPVEEGPGTWEESRIPGTRDYNPPSAGEGGGGGGTPVSSDSDADSDEEDQEEVDERAGAEEGPVSSRTRTRTTTAGGKNAVRKKAAVADLRTKGGMDWEWSSTRDLYDCTEEEERQWNIDLAAEEWGRKNYARLIGYPGSD